VAGFACRQVTVTVRVFHRRPPFASDGLAPPLRGLLAPVLSLFPALLAYKLACGFVPSARPLCVRPSTAGARAAGWVLGVEHNAHGPSSQDL